MLPPQPAQTATANLVANVADQVNGHLRRCELVLSRNSLDRRVEDASQAPSLGIALVVEAGLHAEERCARRSRLIWRKPA
jgi:hypothetical protein